MTLLTRAAAKISGSLGRESLLISGLRPGYEWLLDFSSGWRGYETPINGTLFRTDPRTRHLLGDTLEPEVFALLREITNLGDTILDVGSFLGIYAIFLARCAGPNGRVFAFEPTPSVIPTLRRHLSLNHVAERVTVVEAAIGAQASNVEFYTHKQPYRNSVRASDPAGGHADKILVPMTTVDQFCDEQRITPTLVRMDVQGHEFDALLGARRTILRPRRLGFHARQTNSGARQQILHARQVSFHARQPRFGAPLARFVARQQVLPARQTRVRVT